MKYIKIILMAVLGIALPFAIIRVSIEYNALAELFDIVLYLHPIYLPLFCSCFGIKLFKETGKIFLPTIIFNLFLIVVTYFLTVMTFAGREPGLAGVLMALLLFGPLIYSVPVSFIAAAIYKHKNMKDKSQKTTNNSNDEPKE